MINLRKIIIVVCISLFCVLIQAQYYSSGVDPASVKWNKIETENFKIVFADTFQVKAQYVAKVLEEVYKYGGNSLTHKPKKISVLIHSETAYSNGFVTWAPKRIELYNNPNQDMYAQEWLQQLAIHEFRHVVQIDKLNDGLTKMLSYILGEQAVGGVLGLFVPMWFLEGDAVVAETALTESGRGRSPWFQQGMRAQVMDKDIYSYEKAMFGSYKNYVPNHYEMGYLLVAGARAKYGQDIWEEALYKTGRVPLAITPFNQGQKEHSGLNKVKLYKNTFNELKQQWVKQDETPKNEFKEISKISSEYLDYKYVVALGDSGYLAERSGMGVIKQFVFVDNNGGEEVVFTPGSRNREPFTFANNTICWSELEPDPRWDNRMYSVIKTYDLSTKIKKKVTSKSRYFSPAISPDASKIAVVEVDNKNNYRLLILDSSSGEVTKEFKHGANDYLYTPSWNKEGDKIVIVALSGKGKSISVLDVDKEEWSQITPPSFADISIPKWGEGDEILFTAGYSGTEEIYSLINGEIKQLTQSNFGVTGVHLNKNEIVYSRYTSDGFQLVKSNIADLLNKELNLVENRSVKLYEEISKQEIGKPDFNAIDSVADYEVKKYSKWNLFNVHSWAPVAMNLNDAEIGTGVSALSQNLLGTATTSVGYNADSQKSLEKFYFNLKYEGFYPVIEFDVKHGNDRVQYSDDDLYHNEVDTFSFYSNSKRNQTQMNLSVHVPINLTRSKYYTKIQPGAKYGFVNRDGYSVRRTNYTLVDEKLIATGDTMLTSPDFNYQTMEYSLYFHHLLRRSQRDVTYRWGLSGEVMYQHTPMGNYNAGGIFGVHSRLYVPGFLKHHAFTIENNYQYKTMGDAVESRDMIVYRKQGDYFSFPRGYSSYTNDQLYSFKGDYIFPLMNPDLTLPGVLYLKRITSNLFYDFSRASETFHYQTGDQVMVNRNYSSTGFEMRGELHAFRFLFPISLGYRYARLLELNTNKHELLLGLNISGFSLGK
ncbi:TolB family protein [Labilibacter marinus]|uniref:TolB family protein n=1 Tax=Labilibacter marinus TaxID=1477105 RepID=UPI000950326D|nr:hypothetical protein [Labilibacter marinus]